MTLLTTSHAIPRHQADAALSLTDTLAELMPNLALDVAEHPTDADLYQLTWFIDSEFKDNFINHLNQQFHLSSQLNWAQVDESIDYVAATRAAFPPLQVGPFFIARNDETAPQGTLGLAITPNRAFGSGEHATTRGCLENYLELTQQGHQFKNGLDVGTGSAILALAAAKMQGTPFVGTDNDAPSVTIANENATLNAVSNFTGVLDETLQHTSITQTAPYDLIFANILMTPLIELAPAMVPLLAKGGYVILSGFTEDQKAAVHNAYTALGLSHVATRVISTHGGDWCASTFIR